MSKDIEKQVGGSHYEDFTLQPINVIEYYDLNSNQGHILKYVARCRYKKEQLEDLSKALWYARREHGRYVDDPHDVTEEDFEYVEEFLKSDRLNDDEREVLRLLISTSFDKLDRQRHDMLIARIEIYIDKVKETK